MPELYEKIMAGKKTTYRLYEEPDDEPVVYDLTDGQLLTAAGALGVTLLCIFERYMPPHKRNARKIKDVENAILSLFQGSGEVLDPDICDHICACWDMAMRITEKGEP